MDEDVRRDLASKEEAVRAAAAFKKVQDEYMLQMALMRNKSLFAKSSSIPVPKVTLTSRLSNNQKSSEQIEQTYDEPVGPQPQTKREYLQQYKNDVVSEIREQKRQNEEKIKEKRNSKVSIKKNQSPSPGPDRKPELNNSPSPSPLREDEKKKVGTLPLELESDNLIQVNKQEFPSQTSRNNIGARDHPYPEQLKSASNQNRAAGLTGGMGPLQVSGNGVRQGGATVDLTNSIMYQQALKTFQNNQSWKPYRPAAAADGNMNSAAFSFAKNGLLQNAKLGNAFNGIKNHNHPAFGVLTSGIGVPPHHPSQYYENRSKHK